MQLSDKDIQKGCNIAANLVATNLDTYKPAKRSIRNAKGWICAKEYLGMYEETIGYVLKCQWNTSIAGSIWREYEYVHVIFECFTRDNKRMLHLSSIHIVGIGLTGKCMYCKPFSNGKIIESDSSLHEY